MADLYETVRAAADRVELTYTRSRPLVPPLDWYAVERDRAALLSEGYGVPLDRVLGVLSALSPRQRWEFVRERAPAVIEGEDPGGFYGRSIRNARRILDGEPIARVLDPRTSPKTWDFYRALRGDDVAVVDVWAARIAGLRVTSVRRYLLARLAYHVAAEEVGESPRIVQATTWEGVRDRGVPIPSAVVPDPERVTQGGLRGVTEALDPATRTEP